jgi:hypothetical protein
VVGILAKLHADLFVLQEVAGPTEVRPGLLDTVAAALTAGGAGDCAVDYTKAGGEQWVAMMWDRDWLRAKADVAELFARGSPDSACTAPTTTSWSIPTAGASRRFRPTTTWTARSRSSRRWATPARAGYSPARASLDADRNLYRGAHETALKRIFRRRGIGPVE